MKLLYSTGDTVLNDLEFDAWCHQLNLSESSRQIVEHIRSSEPSRRVQSGRRNVSGCYPSRKMGVTIQFESHRNELARIYELEHDSDVLEYYDQPPPIELYYKAKSGRQNRHRYTPDFFVIRTNSAGWEECKVEEDLIRLAVDSPNRYQKAEHGNWRCPPGEEYAEKLGLFFRLWSSASISWIFQQNFLWLEDYFSPDLQPVEEALARTVLAVIKSSPGITLKDLFQSIEDIRPDDIYALIATNQIYVDLEAARLSEPENTKVFLDREIWLACQRITETSIPVSTYVQEVKVAAGIHLLWDGEVCEVANTGVSATWLLKPDGKLVEIPNIAFEELVQGGKIGPIEPIDSLRNTSELEKILHSASPKDIAEANRRFELLQPYLNEDTATQPSRTLRRWRSAFWQAEKLYGAGYIGLFPKHRYKGNRQPRVDNQSLEFMVHYIEKHYETTKQRRVQRVYEAYVEACKSHELKLQPLSRMTFTDAIKKRAGCAQTLKREGRRAAIQQEPFYWRLELTTPQHGSRPFEVVHIDHTQLDVELVSSIGSLSQIGVKFDGHVKHNLGRPWATFMIDAYSRRLLAVYITYEEPSYRSCMMVLRICVQRFQRLPQIVVVDNGSEFHSIYFDQLMAHYCCTKKYRPSAVARFGNVVERLFGTANTQLIHELAGNTQIMKRLRHVTKSVNPKGLAIWTLEDLYEAVCEWAYEIYDQLEHPSLGQTPRNAFAAGLALGGSRLHKRIAHDETFRILTLPAPKGNSRKVQPGQGVKVNNIYYWSNSFRDPEIELSSIDVRFDPFDAGTVYALVRGQWVKCISAYYPHLQGRSQKEICLLSTELFKRMRKQGQQQTVSERDLVQFLNSVEAKEGQLLEQRLKAVENKGVLQMIEGKCKSSPEQSEEITIEASINTGSRTEQENESKELFVKTNNEEECNEFEYYGEF